MVKLKPIMRIHGDFPLGVVLAVEYDRNSMVCFLRIPCALRQCIINVQVFIPLYLDMNEGKTYNVSGAFRGISTVLCRAVAVKTFGLAEPYGFPFSGGTFLLTINHH
jgi:hypothetical protein